MTDGLRAAARARGRHLLRVLSALALAGGAIVPRRGSTTAGVLTVWVLNVLHLYEGASDALALGLAERRTTMMFTCAQAAGDTAASRQR